MHTRAIGLAGASGYSGIEATRILSAHPRVELRFVTSDRWQGSTVAERLGVSGPAGALGYENLDRSRELAKGCDAVILATPAEFSVAAAPFLLERGITVIDISGAFRLKEAAEYPLFYNFQHPAPHLLATAAYGLPELFRSEIPGASLIANPGCYPTGAVLALAPFLKGQLLDDGPVIFDAASGTTGAGRKGTEDMSFAEVDEDFRAYRVLKHQHTPEIAQTLFSCRGTRVPMTFTAHLLPAKRGLFTTAYARLRENRSTAELVQVAREFYRSEPFVTVLGSAEEVNLRSVVGTNRCLLGIASQSEGYDPKRLVVVSAIDNLVKGAAGQAVQNLNIAMGWPETEGLLNLRGFYP
ncbi:MAG TPA: N-acetyl-gamma-glutamyl-phosphate reductase [Myxococcales bacterium]